MLHNTSLRHGLKRFATTGIPDARRIALWEQHNARSLVGLRARTIDGGPLEANIFNLSLPSFQLAKVTGTPHIVERDATQVSEQPAGGIVAYFSLRGRSIFSHRGGSTTLAPGHGIVYDADQPFERKFTEGLSELVLKIPRETLATLTGSPNLVRPHTFTFSGRTGPADTRTLAMTIDGALGGQVRDWDALEVKLTDLLGPLLGGREAGRHVATAESYIARHLSSPDLSAANISAAVGISERQLSRVFSEAGRSVPQAVLEARMTAARTALADGAQASAPLSEIAVRCGFASQAVFSRSYRSHFGTSPLKDRRELDLST